MSNVVAVPKSMIKQFLNFFPSIELTILSEPSCLILLILILINFFKFNSLISMTFKFKPFKSYLIFLKARGTTFENKIYFFILYLNNLLKIFLINLLL